MNTTATPSAQKPIKEAKPKKPAAPKKAPSTKKPAPAKANQGAKDAKAQLAKNAANIRKLEAEQKKNGTKPAPAIKDGGTLMVLPKLVECKDSLQDIQARCLVLSPANNGVSLNRETTPGEFVRLLDGARKSEENIQFIIGDLMNAGEKLAEKWEGVGRGKYEPFLVSTGRKIDALKHYRMVAKAIPIGDRLLPYTHCRELVKVPELEDRRKIITEAVETQKKEGRKVSSKEIKAKADEIAPPKAKVVKKGAAGPVKVPDALREVHVMTVEENDIYGQILATAKVLDEQIQGAAFIVDISGEQKMPLREALERVTRFYGKLA